MTIEKDATLRHLRSAAGLGLCAALFLAGCSDEPTMPLDDTAGSERPGAMADVVQRLDCTVDLSKGGDLECEPASGTSSGGPNYNLIVGSQHRFVRMTNSAPVMEDDVWTADVTVQNLTLQPFGTLDGENADAAGVRVFFVEEPTNGVEVSNHDGEATFTGSEPQKYYEYSGTALGDDGVLTPSETSGAKTWRFALNGATEFQFSVLVWTEVPDPGAYSVRLTRISGGGDHTCGDGSDGNVYCWGDNYYGQLGDGTTTERWTPVPVQAPAGVTLSGVSAGNLHTCANGSDGNVYCWGHNSNGQLGDGTDDQRLTPVPAQAPEGVRLSGVSAGTWHTCAEDTDGSVYCWGWNGHGQLGDGTKTERWTPVAVQAPEGVTLSGVVTGNYHTCANGSDDKLYCWGSNGSGQLGDGTNTGRDTPVAVQAPEGVTLSGGSAGDSHTCANGSDDKIYCWGDNFYGQHGDGTYGWQMTPVAAQAPEGVRLSGVSAGREHTCALSAGGPAYCWGYNKYGQLGDGRTATSILPVIVAGTR